MNVFAAFHYMIHDKHVHMQTSKQALAFVMGTGLDVMLQCYGIEYDPDDLRETFYKLFHVEKT